MLHKSVALTHRVKSLVWKPGIRIFTQPAPPIKAVTACEIKNTGAACGFQAPDKYVSGTCQNVVQVSPVFHNLNCG